MILTDREIRIHLDRGLITINPRPKDDAYSSTSVDLTLDPVISEYKEPKKGVETIIDPSSADFRGEAVLADLTVSKAIDETQGYLLEPRKLILAWTQESVDLKFDARLAARVEGKSSLARLGLAVHMTAPTIHAGFKGRIRLEVVNHGLHTIRLRPGMRFCQLIFEQTLGTPDRGYQGLFFQQ